MFKGKKILLGISGSTAAYKAADLARMFIHNGAEVQVILTEAACKFITPLTFCSLTGQRAYSAKCVGGPDKAISLAREADLAIVAPATARTLEKVATDTSVDFLSTALHACTCPVVLAPAMKVAMFAGSEVQEHVRIIKGIAGHYIVPPGYGTTACGEVGEGKLASPLDIFDYCSWVLSGGYRDLVGEKVVVTAGPTMEDFDPVRYLTNRSTGKMGYAIAKRAALRGADVTVISASGIQPIPPGCRHIETRTALSMAKAVDSVISEATVLVMAAAVADYTPKNYQYTKIKKQSADGIELERTRDILATLPEDPKRITVGFAAETDHLLANAEKKLVSKRLDMLVANDVSVSDCGFGTDTNQVTILRPGMGITALAMMHKIHVADFILDRIVTTRKSGFVHEVGAPYKSSTEMFTT